MLLVGSFDTKKQARVFSNYLLAQSFENKMVSEEALIEVWVVHEAHLQAAKEAYRAYQQSPMDPQFHVKPEIKKDDTRRLKAHYRRTFKRRHGNQLTLVLMGVCIVVFLLMLTDLRQEVLRYLLIGVSSQHVIASWLTQPWRLLTPIFLHFGVIHILFNLFWLYDLGSLVEEKESRWFFVGLVIFCGLLSNLLQFFVAGPSFGGMSGVVYGLFAYIWISAKMNPWSGYYIRSDIVFWMLGWFVLCFSGWLGPVANFGHLGGLLAGGGLAWVKSLRRR